MQQVRSGPVVMAEVTFLVAWFQHPAILNDDTDFAIKLDLREQALHGGRQHLGSAHLAAELGKASLLSFPRDMRHGSSFLPPKTSCAVQVIGESSSYSS